MNYKQITEAFKVWSKEVGISIDFSQAEPVTLLIHDVEETSEYLTGEIFYSFSVYTEQFHTFIFSEKTFWQKDDRGNTVKTLTVEYTLVENI